MKTLALLVLLSCCPPADRLTVSGQGPADAWLVLLVAQEHCPRQIVGSLRWTTESLDGVHDGYCLWDDCSMDAWVAWYPAAPDGWRAPASATLLAHEVGHWCLGDDETAVGLWSAAVNQEAADLSR